MAELTTIARPYAEAVFQLADQTQTLDAWSRTLGRLAQVASHPEAAACVGDPAVSAAALSDLFMSLAGAEVSAEAKNFVSVLIDNDRLALLPEIRDLFEAAKHEREGVLEAQVHTAFPLEDGQLGMLVNHLESKYKRKVQPSVTVDQELIGGVKVVIGDEVIDASVRGKLANMRAALTS